MLISGKSRDFLIICPDQLIINNYNREAVCFNLESIVANIIIVIITHVAKLLNVVTVQALTESVCLIVI